MTGRRPVVRRSAVAWALAGAGALAAVWAAFASPVASAGAEPTNHPNALWRVVHDLCVPDRRLLGLPLPCVAVDLKAGYAVVPDPGGLQQLLVAPTRRVAGVEDPFLLQPDAPNYWQDAWGVRGLLARRLGKPLPRDAVGMAVNSVAGRSQEQLHIHLSCIRSDVAKRLRALAPDLGGERWSSVRLGRQAWLARTVAGEDLGDQDPFKLAATAPDATDQMARMTVVVVGATLADGQPGFYVLARLADPSRGETGHGENLLDEGCRDVAPAPAGAG